MGSGDGVGGGHDTRQPEKLEKEGKKEPLGLVASSSQSRCAAACVHLSAMMLTGVAWFWGFFVCVFFLKVVRAIQGITCLDVAAQKGLLSQLDAVEFTKAAGR